MPSFLNIFLFFGLLASLVSAAPRAIQKRSFKVERVRNANFKGHDGPRELLKAYQKYRMDVPPALLDAINNKGKPDSTENVQTKASSQTGKAKGKGRKGGKGAGAAVGGNNGTTAAVGNSTAGVGLVTATPEAGDVEYLSPVEIGGQTLNLDFDSGSSDLWVFNSQLSAKATTGHTVYDPTKSTGFKMINGASFSISYGDGSGAAGNVGTDTVVIGGATVTQQAIELATAVSQSFVSDTANNGLLGLAFSKLNTVKPQQQKTFFDNVMPSLAEPVFTADLRKNAVGAYEFGRIDSAKFTGAMAWIPVNTTQGFWQFATAGFAVGNGTAQTATAAQAIADTGTTLILTSQEIADGYYGQVQGAVNDATVGGVTVPCDATLPDLILDVGGIYQARVKGEDINFAQVQGNTCFGGVQATTSDLQIWGDIFFKSQFVAFNGGNNTLGMAQHV
ncbi:acid protease [Coniochaeta ligniaria NRRL 30616]|uniref:Acid protease n=1 Tax=Coniochaeta ligniaria NRRL 30616 TaxID=1408157 RepID=A0A1J7IZS5_9PEZI|nr:acid protease [Coniochaeta ligniaria NRRL 30616]